MKKPDKKLAVGDRVKFIGGFYYFDSDGEGICFGEPTKATVTNIHDASGIQIMLSVNGVLVYINKSWKNTQNIDSKSIFQEKSKPNEILPPRVWIYDHAIEQWKRIPNAVNNAYATPQDMQISVEYLPIIEHTQLISQAVKEARAAAFEEAANLVADKLPKPFTDQLVYGAIMELAKAARNHERKI